MNADSASRNSLSHQEKSIMAYSVTPVGDNPFQPGMVAETYTPDQLIAGDLKLVTLSATITGAAAYTRGTIMGQVTASGKWIPSLPAAVDGSQTPAGILVDNIDTTTADGTCGIYVMGEFNGNCTNPLGSALTQAQLAQLRLAGIFIKTPVPAADPT
jgi:Bacteriophage lambda head decoration protein D